MLPSSSTLTLGILLTPDTLGAMAVGTLDLLRQVDEAFCKPQGLTRLALHALAPEPELTLGPGLRLVCEPLGQVERSYDYILVPALDWLSLPQALDRLEPAALWLAGAAAAGTRVGSMCCGVFVLAAAGLLEGQRATVHWAFSDLLKTRFPQVQVDSRQLLVESGRTFTGGGATTFLNFLLYFIDRILGRSAMLWAARVFLIDPDRSTQAYFGRPQLPSVAQGSNLERVLAHLNAHFREELSLAVLADLAAWSERHLVRCFKAETGLTPLAYQQQLRLEAARLALEQGELRVKEVAYDVGYSDEKTFRSLFQRHTGLSPTAYRKKFRLGTATSHLAGLD